MLKAALPDEPQTVIGFHSQNIGLAAIFQHAAQAQIRSVHGISQHKSARNAGIEGRCDEIAGNLGFGGEVNLFRHLRFGPAVRVFRPGVRQIEPPVDQRLPEPARISQENADLRVLDAPRRPRILPGYAHRRRAFFHKACFIHDQNAIGIAKRFNDIGADGIAQTLLVPLAATQKRLHPVRASQSRLLRHQPAGLALDPRQQAVQKMSGRFSQLLPGKHRASRALNDPSSCSQSRKEPVHEATRMPSLPRIIEKGNHVMRINATVVLVRHSKAGRRSNG